MTRKLFDHFCLGVNYWPRHRGVDMWHDWHPEEIDREFGEMASLGLNTVRIFLTWPDFQPAKEWMGGLQKVKIATTLAHDQSVSVEGNPAMVDPVMLQRFEHVLRLAEKHNLKLMPAFLTGWMSGVMLMPPFAAGKNIFTDPAVLRYEALYARCLAERFKGHPAILAWDLGNEQNNVNECPSMDAAWVWTNYLATTLKRYDPDRPVTSGMHGLGMSRYGAHNYMRPWQIQDVADSCDFTCPHPYPGFYSDCVDDACSIRTTLLSTFLSKLYAGIGGKPAMCQEFGSLGNCYMSDEVTARYTRVVLYSNLVNGDLGALWWCHTDFTCADRLPYAQNHMENNGLGLFDERGQPKPVAAEYRRFAKLLSKLDYPALAARQSQAAIVVPRFEAHRDDQSKIFMGFILCKQAGIDADVIRPESDFSRYRLLILPSLSTTKPMWVQDWARLLARVKAGATLYCSYDGCSLRDMEDVFGLKVIQRRKPRQRARSLTFCRRFGPFKRGDTLGFLGPAPDWTLDGEAAADDVVATNSEKCPGLLARSYGKGAAVFCAEPIEKFLIGVPHAFDQDRSHRIYSALKTLAGINSGVSLEHPFVQRTLHDMGPAKILTLINHSDAVVRTKAEIGIAAGRVTDVLTGKTRAFKRMTGGIALPVKLGPCECRVFRLDRAD